MKKFANKIKDLDVIGEEFSLNFEGRSRYSTIYGGIISGFLILFSYFVFLKLMSDYIRQDDPDIRQNFSTIPLAPQINLFNDNFAYAITFSGEEEELLQSHKLSSYF